MKKKLLKFTIIIFIFLKSAFIVHANEKIILPEKKPVISKNETSKKIVNVLVPLKKPNLKIEETKTKIVKKITINGEIIPQNKPLFVKTEKSVRAKKSKYYSKKDYEIAKISIKSMEQKNGLQPKKLQKKLAINRYTIL